MKAYIVCVECGSEQAGGPMVSRCCGAAVKLTTREGEPAKPSSAEARGSVAAKAYWEADVSTAVDVVIRLSDNGRHSSHLFIQTVIHQLKGWGEPPNEKGQL